MAQRLLSPAVRPMPGASRRSLCGQRTCRFMHGHRMTARESNGYNVCRLCFNGQSKFAAFLTLKDVNNFLRRQFGSNKLFQELIDKAQVLLASGKRSRQIAYGANAEEEEQNLSLATQAKMYFDHWRDK